MCKGIGEYEGHRGSQLQLREPQRRTLGLEEREEMSCPRPIWGLAGGSWVINNSASKIKFLALINQKPLQPSLPSGVTCRP